MKTYMKNIRISGVALLLLSPALMNAQLKVTTAGNVGINTSTPNISATGKALTIVGVSNRRGIVDLKNPGATSGGSVCGGIRFYNATNESAVLDITTGTTATSGQYRFYVRNAAGTNTERVRIDEDGKMGIGTTTPGYTLDINGTAHCSASAWSSDKMLKTKVESLTDALAIINKLKPKSYFFDTANPYGLVLPSEKQYGFIAQELEEVLPELITKTTKGAVLDSLGKVIYPEVTYRAVYYLELIGILTKGVQELSATLEKQEEALKTQNAAMEALQNQVAGCCNDLQGTLNTTGAGTAYGNGINDAQTGTSPVLFQNVPNPFSQQTSISYFIPAKFQSASIMVFDLNGKLMTTLPVTSQGKGAITINGSQLNPGMFVYSLIIDGKIIDTKRMILTQ